MSNLIEQLGGYEQANSKLLKMDKILKEVYYSHSDEQKANELRQALLEHRRANNIFEVGDYALPNSSHSDEVHFLSEWYIDGLDFKYKTSSGGWGIIVRSCMTIAWRHATNEEIEVGHRLPQLEVLDDPNTIILGDK